MPTKKVTFPSHPVTLYVRGDQMAVEQRKWVEFIPSSNEARRKSFETVNSFFMDDNDGPQNDLYLANQPSVSQLESSPLIDHLTMRMFLMKKLFGMKKKPQLFPEVSTEKKVPIIFDFPIPTVRSCLDSIDLL